MSLNFDDLRLLIEIVEYGSFTQAAARRRWSQPQVSQRVGALEDQVGVQLFRRHRRGAVPTEACVTFLPAARAALAALDLGLRSVQGVPALPKMGLACVPSLASMLFGPILLALAQAPMEIRCTTNHSPIIMDMLLTDRAQLGFVLRCPAIAGIELERICVSPIIAVVHRDHRLARSPACVLADIANAQLAPQFWGPQCDELIGRLHAYRTTNMPIHAIQPASAALELVLEHGFLTFMPEMAVAKQLQDGSLVKLDIADLPLWEWEVMMAWRSGKRVDASKQMVLRVVREIAAAWTPGK
ncbi:LysR family transcriptional regulator [Massilia pseudoviolaceinigra]|uniref:LysR family transcriptional regulator n=1 Tax=Massilia pseudoviolaceinigra TaxID=3057165 RepID=UPI002796D3C2|nr:LysR family transcriptional regulator [Massilia sp. CCM 9206]MDQ1924890.1 LysR family transcriptional regulator [Massilia sp. CCM 9206]